MSSPNDIEVLIWCRCCAAIHPRIDAPAVQDAIQRFLRDGIIEQRENDWYVTTDKGTAWLEAICNVPYPRKAWIDERGEILLKAE